MQCYSCNSFKSLDNFDIPRRGGSLHTIKEHTCRDCSGADAPVPAPVEVSEEVAPVPAPVEVSEEAAPAPAPVEVSEEAAPVEETEEAAPVEEETEEAAPVEEAEEAEEAESAPADVVEGFENPSNSTRYNNLMKQTKNKNKI
jgi:hypothetical protein